MHTLKLDRKMRFVADNGRGHETAFDTVDKVGGENTAATPMEVMLQSLSACSAMDVVSILRKKRKTIDDIQIKIEGERGEKHPKMYINVHIIYELTSPDASLADLERCVELSQDKYCGASAMFKAAGANVTHECILNP